MHLPQKWKETLNRKTWKTSMQGATFRMQNTMRLGRSSMIGVTHEGHETSTTVGGRFDHASAMIRPWKRHLAHAASQGLKVPPLETHFVWKNTSANRNFSEYCACHEKPHLTFTSTARPTRSNTPTSPNIAPVTESDAATLLYSLLDSTRLDPTRL